MISYQPASTGGGGGTGGPETDPVAVPMVVTHRASTDHDAHNDGRYTPTAHQTAADPHGDRSHSDTGDSSHLAAVDPHSSNAHSDGQLSAHVSAVDPHGDRAAAAAHADGADSAHVAAADPHGSIAALNTHKAAAGAHAAPNISLDSTGLLIVNGADVKTAIAQLDAEFGARKKLPAAPADAQLPAWNAASGQWQAVNPSGASLLAYAENNTGVTQAGLSNVTVDVTGCAFTVPASTRPVLLSGYIGVYATVAPTTGSVIILITEVSNGVDTPVTIRGVTAPISAINKVLNAIIPMTQLAPSTARARTFKVQATLPISGTWTIENGANNDRSVIAAWAG